MDKKRMLEKIELVDRAFSLLKPIDEKIELYLAGGAACIIIGATTRATMDFDFVDTGLNAKYNMPLSFLGDFDIIDTEVSAISPSYKDRALLIYRGDNITVHTLSAEDLIATKLNRFSKTDQSDITNLLELINDEMLRVVVHSAYKSLSNESAKNTYLKNVRVLCSSTTICSSWRWLDVY